MTTAVIRWASIAAIAVALPPSPVHAFAGDVPPCTQEQEAAFAPFVNNSNNALGCDELTFRTCSDNCLAVRKLKAQNAPNCSAIDSRHAQTYRFGADLELSTCEEARANTTNKYFPQVVPNAPECSTEVLGQLGTDFSFDGCKRDTRRTCTDECLKIIETKITTAPVCTYPRGGLVGYELGGGGYTIGEGMKYVLVDCLIKRKQDLKTNVVLNTIAAVSAKEKSGSLAATTTMTAVAVATTAMAAVVLSLI